MYFYVLREKNKNTCGIARKDAKATEWPFHQKRKEKKRHLFLQNSFYLPVVQF